MKKWNLVPIVALFGLIGAGCADGFSLTGARTIDDGNPAPTIAPVGTEQGNTNEGSGSQDPLPDGGPPIEPPATDPPATDPPATDPPATDPPATDPPTTDPPTTEPPTTTVPPTTEPPTTTVPPTTEPPIRDATITVTLIRFQAIKDCDGIEFNFNSFVATGDGQVRGSTGGYRELTDAAYWNQLEAVTFTLPEVEGSRFDVFFSSSEVDKDIFGTVYNDDRMDALETAASHRFSGGVWTSPPMTSTDLGGTYPNAVQLRNGSGNCTAELHYVVDIT